MRIDLHTHTLHSDGTDTPAELIEKAAVAELNVVAITDHDVVTGWDEAIAAGERHGVRILGMEISTTNQGRGQHLLTYGFDPTHQPLGEMIFRSGNSREDRYKRLLARLDQLGKPVDQQYVEDIAGSTPSRKHVARGMVEAGHVNSDDEAFALWLNEDRDAYVQRYRVEIEDAIRLVADAGGVTVIAHPRDDKRGQGVSEERFAELAAVGLNGIEVDHQSHPDATRQELRAIAGNLGLAVTGSSDYHGTNKVDHDLGCNLTDPDVAEELFP